MQDARPSSHMGDWVPAGCRTHGRRIVGERIAAAMAEGNNSGW